MAPVTIAFSVGLAFVALAAAMWGGRGERVVAAGYVAAYLLSRAVPGTFDFTVPGTARFLIDAALFLVVTGVAVALDRLWVLVSASLLLLLLFGYFARWLLPSIDLSALYVLTNASAFPTLLLLAAGIVQNRLPRRRPASFPAFP